METKTLDPFYLSLQNFTQFACELVKAEELEHLKACFNLIEKLLRNGEPMVRNAISSLFVPSLTAVMNESNLQGQIVKSLPVMLRKEYEKQFNGLKLKSDLSVFILHLN